MSSDTPTFSDLRPRRRAALVTPALALVLCGLLSVACGHKKGPTPPPSKVPQRVTLTAHQRGSEVIVEFPFPTTTISGTPLPGISRIEVWRFGMEVPEFAVELLAEETAQRKEAQDLLDELGLELYETPSILPVEGGVVDPFAPPTTPGTLPDPNAVPTMAGAAQSAGGLPATPLAPPATTPAGTPFAEEPMPAEAPAEQPPAAAEAPIEELGAAEQEASADEDADSMAEVEETEDGEEDGEGEDGEETADEDGEDGSEGEDGEEDGAPELTEEEKLALRVEAARNLLRSPPTPKSNFIAATTKDFNKGAELVLTVEADDIGGVVVGDLIVLRVPLPPRVEEGPETGYLFGAKIFAMNGKPSDLSNTVALLPESVPPAPRDVTVAAQADGVLINWAADEEPEGGFRIYRRDAQSRAYGKAIAVLPGAYYTYLDRQAIFGARYIYGLTAIATTTPLLESDISSEHEVDYQDRFGPAVPGGLVAFPEAGRVRLLWTPVPDADLAGYEIRRRASAEDEPEVRTVELITRSQYLDEGLTTGDTWLYSVVAVDQLGNRSAASAEAQARVP